MLVSHEFVGEITNFVTAISQSWLCQHVKSSLWSVDPRPPKNGWLLLILVAQTLIFLSSCAKLNPKTYFCG